MEKELIFQMCGDGSIYSKTPEEWREMLAVLAQIGGQNPSVHQKASQCSETIRHLIALDDARRSQRQTILWARIAAGLAGLGILIGLFQLLKCK